MRMAGRLGQQTELALSYDTRAACSIAGVGDLEPEAGTFGAQLGDKGVNVASPVKDECVSSHNPA